MVVELNKHLRATRETPDVNGKLRRRHQWTGGIFLCPTPTGAPSPVSASSRDGTEVLFGGRRCGLVVGRADRFRGDADRPSSAVGVVSVRAGLCAPRSSST
ncbi:hypothetical protein [Micromonospora lupini]|uniref:hypothetical protein n=1 Tax=Micromonospora lupini TaxID=285679 RepID=UPI0033FF726C